MPLKTDRLTPKSSKEAKRKAVSADISELSETRPRKQAVAIALSNARKRTTTRKR